VIDPIMTVPVVPGNELPPSDLIQLNMLVADQRIPGVSAGDAVPVPEKDVPHIPYRGSWR